jgi:hypothetical protein
MSAAMTNISQRAVKSEFFCIRLLRVGEARQRTLGK